MWPLGGLLGASWGPLGRVLRRLGASWGAPGSLLGGSWGSLGMLLGVSTTFWAELLAGILEHNSVWDLLCCFGVLLGPLFIFFVVLLPVASSK